MTQQQRINEYRGLTSQLMDYGWFAAPFIVGAEHTRIKKLAAYITANPPEVPRINVVDLSGESCGH
jgi:hypothetical protein